MTDFAYTLLSELNDPKSLVDQAQRAEASGFDGLVISDHIHPWLNSHPHSPFAWSVLGAVAHATSDARLMTMVTCPTIRYHPAIIAQAAATIAMLSDGRFTLGLGSGERLNEHVVGQGWPAVDVRHEMLGEAVEIITKLWSGGYHTFRGKHLTLEDAQVFSLPERPPGLAIAVSGPDSIDLATSYDADMIGVDPDPDVVRSFRDGSSGPRRVYGQVALSYDRDRQTAIDHAQRFSFGTLGWKVMAELPNPVNFEAAVAPVREEDVVEAVACGPDPQVHLEAIREFAEAGYDEVAVVHVGEDHEGFFRFWERELAPQLR